MAYSCLPQAGYTVVFRRWKPFSEMLVEKGADSVSTELRKEGFDCILGGIDLSIRCVSCHMAGSFCR